MKFQELVNTGLSLIQDEPNHDLKLGFRCRLLSGFDEPGGSERGHTGRRKRVRLATLAVEKVLPLWGSIFPADQMPHHALEISAQLIAQTVPSTTAVKETGRMWTHCDDLMWKHEDKQTVIMVGYGAIQVVREALSETKYGCAQVNDATSDLDVDPYEHDSSFFAASAYSGGAPWEGTSEPRRRLEFWTWWLTSALVTAMNLR
jgi:hypothetical protein